MMDELVLHNTTRAQLERFISAPVHAVLITGPDGIGKTAVAEAMLCSLLQTTAVKLAAHPYVLRVGPEGQSISIEAIRGLQKFLQLKTIGTARFRRAVLIEHAQALTTEAQNAFLKLLEEPPADTLLVLTADSPRALLPTILSRLQTVVVHPPLEAALQTLARGKQPAQFRQAYFLSGGLPGLLCALLADDIEHPLLGGVAAAKDILQKQPFDRLALVDTLSKQKDTARSVLEALERIATAGLQAATTKQDAARLKQWHRIRTHTLAARQALEQSANAKLTFTNLFLQLP